MVAIILPPPPLADPTTLDELIKKLGLGSSLIWDVDAGDALSYTSGQSLGVLPSGGSVQLTLGNDSGVDAARDAVFNGVSGRQTSAEYWATNGTTVTPVTRLGAPLGTWSNNAHKDNALFTFAGVFYTDASSDGSNLLATFGDTIGTVGVVMGLAPSSPGPAQHPYMDIGNGSGATWAAQPVTASLVASKGQIIFVGYSVNEAGNTCIFALNGSSESVACTYTSPSAAVPAFPNAIVSASNNINTNNGKIFNAAWWNRALSASELYSLYYAQKSKFGF